MSRLLYTSMLYCIFMVQSARCMDYLKPKPSENTPTLRLETTTTNSVVYSNLSETTPTITAHGSASEDIPLLNLSVSSGFEDLTPYKERLKDRLRVEELMSKLRGQASDAAVEDGQRITSSGIEGYKFKSLGKLVCECNLYRQSSVFRFGEWGTTGPTEDLGGIDEALPEIKPGPPPWEDPV